MKSVLLAVVLVGCRAPAARSTEKPDAPPAAAIPPPASETTTSRQALVDRYCHPLAALSARVLDACECPVSERASRFVSNSELTASCEYHLLTTVHDDVPLRVDDAALQRCVTLLEASLTGCTRARLPHECELSQIVAPVHEPMALARGEGAPCRATNGDEGFDAHFLCASGLMCKGGVCERGDPSPGDRCRNPLQLPAAIP